MSMVFLPSLLKITILLLLGSNWSSILNDIKVVSCDSAKVGKISSNKTIRKLTTDLSSLVFIFSLYCYKLIFTVEAHNAIFAGKKSKEINKIYCSDNHLLDLTCHLFVYSFVVLLTQK